MHIPAITVNKVAELQRLGLNADGNQMMNQYHFSTGNRI